MFHVWGSQTKGMEALLEDRVWLLSRVSYYYQLTIHINMYARKSIVRSYWFLLTLYIGSLALFNQIKYLEK